MSDVQQFVSGKKKKQYPYYNVRLLAIIVRELGNDGTHDGGRISRAVIRPIRYDSVSCKVQAQNVSRVLFVDPPT